MSGELPISDDDLRERVQWRQDIGRGGIGRISAVTLQPRHELIVLKQLPRPQLPETLHDGWNEKQIEALFKNERDVLQYIWHRLSHPSTDSQLREIGEQHLIRLMGSFDTSADYNLLLSPVAKCNLLELLDAYVEAKSDSVTVKGYRMNKAIASQWLKQSFGPLAATVNCMHSLGVRHRDITPKNILYGCLDKNGILSWSFYLCDFGIAHIEAREGHKQTGDRARSGPPLSVNETWTSPERLQKVEETRGDDMYNVGLVFLEIFTVLRGQTVPALKEYLKVQAANEGQGANTRQQTERNLIRVREVDCEHDVVAAWLASLTSPGKDDGVAKIILQLVSNAILPTHDYS